MVDVCTVMAVSLPGGTRMNHVSVRSYTADQAPYQRKAGFGALDFAVCHGNEWLRSKSSKIMFPLKGAGKIFFRFVRQR
jgi:hypothetical protein